MVPDPRVFSSVTTFLALICKSYHMRRLPEVLPGPAAVVSITWGMYRSSKATVRGFSCKISGDASSNCMVSVPGVVSAGILNWKLRRIVRDPASASPRGRIQRRFKRVKSERGGNNISWKLNLLPCRVIPGN